VSDGTSRLRRGSNLNPQNTLNVWMPVPVSILIGAVKIFVFLDLEQNLTFFKGLKKFHRFQETSGTAGFQSDSLHLSPEYSGLPIENKAIK
jgi:hypothetical protein